MNSYRHASVPVYPPPKLAQTHTHTHSLYLGPGGLEATGLDPRGAVVRISPFGQTGPRADEPATDLTVQASGGWVSNHGIPGLDPLRVGGRAPA